MKSIHNLALMPVPDLPHFRFDAIDHRYFLDGLEVPHIHRMLEQTGWMDDTWMTEESSARGREVHRLTAQHDLGALDLATVAQEHKGYVLAYVKALTVGRVGVASVEEACVHPTLKFGGRPDRTVKIQGLRGVLEIKTGQPMKGHPIQLALQAFLVADHAQLPPEALARFCVYLTPTGKFRLVEFTDRRDLDEAYRVIQRCC